MESIILKTKESTFLKLLSTTGTTPKHMKGCNNMLIFCPELAYFNATYAHRDIAKHNLFTFQFRNGDEEIPAYDHGTTAGRIYIGFPTKD